MKKSILKKWWFWFIIIITLGLILAPYTINEVYKINSDNQLWNHNDMLSFYGAVLSFSGTVALGMVSVWQTKKANEINDRLLKLEMKSKRGYFIPDHQVEVKSINRKLPKPILIEEPGIPLLCCGDDNICLSSVKCKIYERIVNYDFSIFVTN